MPRLKFDWLVVGAGFSGCVMAERLATVRGQRVLVVDARSHIGGNAYDYYDEHGILVHKYGPHIFHTNSKMVWDYLSNFTGWRPYFHRVLGVVEGKKVPIPFNLNSISQLFPRTFAENLEAELLTEYGFGVRVPILKLLEANSPNLNTLANYIYKHVFHGYTTKQWGVEPTDLDPSVTARVPVTINRDDRYFSDTYQAMPKFGYTYMFQNMINQRNIKVLLNTDYREIIDQVSFNRLIFTGPIDSFFDHMHGSLPYRSLRFEMQHLAQEHYQEVGTVNYPSEFDFTRITEQKYLTGQKHAGTSILIEHPETYIAGQNQPYYPIPQKDNNDMYKLYVKEAQKLQSVTFLGRLAEYKYYNMDQVVARALTVFKNL